MVTDISDLLQDDEDNDTPTITKLRRALKSIAKERDTAVDEASTYKTKAREGSVTSWLDKAKIKPEVKDYVPDDVDSEAALVAWLSGPGSLFAGLKVADADPEPAGNQPPATQVDFGDTDTGRLLAQVAASEAGARSVVGGDLGAIQSKMAEALQADNEEAFYAALANAIPDGLVAEG